MHVYASSRLWSYLKESVMVVLEHLIWWIKYFMVSAKILFFFFFLTCTMTVVLGLWAVYQKGTIHSWKIADYIFFFGISYIITPNIFFSFILLKWWYTLKKDNDPLLVDKYEDLRTSIYRLWEQPCCSINMAANLFARNQWYVSWVLYPNLRLSLNIQCPR